MNEKELKKLQDDTDKVLAQLENEQKLLKVLIPVMSFFTIGGAGFLTIYSFIKISQVL